DLVLQRSRLLYTVALEQHTTRWGRGTGKRASYCQQAAELPYLKASCPDYGEVHSQVLQDVLRRVDQAYSTFFRRMQGGEQGGVPPFLGQGRYPSFRYPQYGNGVVLDGGALSLFTIGRVSIRLYRPLHRTPKTVTLSRQAAGWYVSYSSAQVLT